MPSADTMRLTATRLLPVLSSTASAAYAYSEVWALFPFLQLQMPSQAISVWWSGSLNSGIGTVLTIGLTSTVGGYLGWKNSIGAARTLYGWGTVFSLAHFVYVPAIMPIIKRAIYGPTEQKDELRKWLRTHAVRTLTADIPALVCFIGAFLHLDLSE